MTQIRGKVAQIASANFCTNGTFESATTGWTAVTAGTMTRDATQKHSGSYSLKYVYTGGLSGYPEYVSANVLASTIYEVAVWLYLPATSTEVWLDVLYPGSSIGTFSNAVTRLANPEPKAAWFKITDVVKAGVTSQPIKVRLRSETVNDVAYIDDVSIVASLRFFPDGQTSGWPCPAQATADLPTLAINDRITVETRNPNIPLVVNKL